MLVASVQRLEYRVRAAPQHELHHSERQQGREHRCMVEHGRRQRQHRQRRGSEETQRQQTLQNGIPRPEVDVGEHVRESDLDQVVLKECHERTVLIGESVNVQGEDVLQHAPVSGGYYRLHGADVDPVRDKNDPDRDEVHVDDHQVLCPEHEHTRRGKAS